MGKTSWEYQKGNYKQINIKFNLNDADDALLFHFAANRTVNTTALIKNLLRDEMMRCAYGEE